MAEDLRLVRIGAGPDTLDHDTHRKHSGRSLT